MGIPRLVGLPATTQPLRAAVVAELVRGGSSDTTARDTHRARECEALTAERGDRFERLAVGTATYLPHFAWREAHDVEVEISA